MNLVRSGRIDDSTISLEQANEIESLFNGLRIKHLIILEKWGDQDAINLLRFFKDFTDEFSWAFYLIFTQENFRVAKDDEARLLNPFKKPKGYKGRTDFQKHFWYFSKNRLFHSNRWWFDVYYAYRLFCKEFYTVHERMGVYKPEGDELWVLYHILLPTAIYLAFKDFEKLEESAYVLGKGDYLGSFSSLVRTHIERMLFNGLTTDMKECRETQMNGVLYDEDPVYPDEVDYGKEASHEGSRGMSESLRMDTLIKLSFEIDSAERSDPARVMVPAYSDIYGYTVNDDEWDRQLVLSILAPFTNEQRQLLKIEQGDLTRLAKETGWHVKTLSKRRERLIKKIQQSYAGKIHCRKQSNSDWLIKREKILSHVDRKTGRYRN